MLAYQIGITLLPGVGDVIGKKLIAYCGGAEAVFKESREALKKIPGIGSKLIDSIFSHNVLDRAKEEIEFIEKNNIQPLFYLDKQYPARLKNCEDSPIMLYQKGHTDLNTAKVVSIVGTRKATEYGKEICNKIVEGLAGYNVLVLSGLAYGIDTCAHKAALDHGLHTAAVLGHGLDRIYPYLNKPLSEKICDHGALLAEFMSQTLPDRENFPKRNRIIAGMSDAVVVVEAALSGGALITAEIANSYNRDVFSVPGRLGDVFSEGCNKLIKINKAALLQSAEDIAYIMGWQRKENMQTGIQRQLFVELTPLEESIVNMLRNADTLGLDEMSLALSLPVNKVSSTLLTLEFQGLVRALPGSLYRLNR
ncbi:MAG TPA: DNA-processing protein DprA [Bacteroidales bacterium]|nr:DNA-processing protein DprA [Bacteroidales bacterium]